MSREAPLVPCPPRTGCSMVLVRVPAVPMWSPDVTCIPAIRRSINGSTQTALRSNLQARMEMPGRDTITGPNLWNLDNSLTKDWAVTPISEQFRVQFRAEAFNIFNHQSFGQPANNVFAGTAVNASAGRITFTTSAPRQIQLALKIVF